MNNKSIICFFLLSLCMLVIFFLDLRLGNYISMYTLYFIPIILSSWRFNFKVGLMFSVLAGIYGFSTDIFLKPEGNIFFLLITALTRLLVLIIVSYSFWRIKSLMKLLTIQSEKDHLTGIYNRRGFFLHGQIELDRMVRSDQPMSLMYIDLNDFKEINDSFGHEAGDEILNIMVVIIKSRIRKIDLFARLGGDEFVVLLPFTNSKGAYKVGEEILVMIQKELSINSIFVGASIGIASFNTPPSSLSYSLSCADSLMYKVKKTNECGILQEIFPPSLE